MSIRETTILKGVAILFMLYLHLFNQMANVNLCTTYLSIRGVPFVHLFSRCTGPVAFYLFGQSYLYSHQLAYMPVLYMSLLFPFMLGAMLVKYDIINKCKLWRCKSLFILLLLMVVRMYLETGVFHVLYSVAFIVLFVQIKRPVWLDTFLYEMGCRSTSMWFVHTYFCYYLFKDFIYGFKYPLLIFSVLLVVSYLFALVIDRIYQPLQQLITQKWR